VNARERSMHVHVLFHDRCFDGAASAATFTRFYRDRIDPSATFSYKGMNHKPGSSFEPSPFTDAPVHACVDFRYSASPKLTWWFDHHQSAFETPEGEAHFRKDTSGRQFHDPKAPSCTGFIARIAREKFGFDARPLDELIKWAEIIDAAKFPDARTAVVMDEPAIRLMMIIEAATDPDFLPRLIADFTKLSLRDVLQEPYVRERFDPLFAAHQKNIEIVRERAKFEQGIVTYDVADLGIDNINKFITYYLYPNAEYTVSVSAGPKRAKVSVGSNPWPVVPRRHNLAAICESYGGGGHPVVGAVSFPPDQIPRAREVAAEIVERLRK
jgi:hypothetical protein